MISWKIFMIKFFILSTLLLLTSKLWSANTPSSKSGLETGIDFRALKQISHFILLGETKNRKEILGNDYHQLLLGSYYRLTKRWRVGLFMQGEQGLRWDSDWEKQGGQWRWQHLDSRWDFATVADSTYNNTISSNWVWEFKNRIFYYHSRQAAQLRTRPGLRYFILKDGQPWWQIYGELEAYIPLNYGKRSLYEYWCYLGRLYQVNSRFGIGPVISYRGRWFHSYDAFEKKTGKDFKTQFLSTYMGISAVYVW
jgi:hypothetical protein